jgi:hypothetical protein
VVIESILLFERFFALGKLSRFVINFDVVGLALHTDTGMTLQVLLQRERVVAYNENERERVVVYTA